MNMLWFGKFMTPRRDSHIWLSFLAFCPLLASSFCWAAPGDLLWANRAGGTSDDFAATIAPSPDSGVFVTGYFSQTAGFGLDTQDELQLTAFGGRDVFVAKYDSTGSVLWAKQAGGAATDQGSSSAIDEHGDGWVTGSFSDRAVFAPGEENETFVSAYSPLEDMFIASYGPDGTLNWVKRAGGFLNDGGFGVAALPDDCVFVTGYFADVAVFGFGEGGETWLTTAGDNDIFIAEFASDGSLLWAKQAGGPGPDIAYDVEVSPDGGAVVTGYFSATATFGPGEEFETQLTADGGKDIFLAKYNADGTLAWVKQAGGKNGDDVGRRLAITADGGALVTGLFSSAAVFGPYEQYSTLLVSAGLKDIFAARYDAAGTLVWARGAGGSGGDEGSDIAMLPDGSSLVTGLFRNTATFGAGESYETQLLSAGETDGFVVKYLASGDVAWARRAGGSLLDSGAGIAVLPDGNAVIAGRFQNTATFGSGEPYETVLTSDGNNDIFVAKYEVSPCLRTGDVTGDSLMTAEDAQLAFMVVLGTYEPTATERCAADCNGDGVVSAGDAQQIFAAVLAMGSCVDPL